MLKTLELKTSNMLRAHTFTNPYPRLRHETWVASDPFQPIDHCDFYGRIPRSRVQTAGNTAPSLPLAPVEFGTTGEDVTAIQNALHSLGYFGAEPVDCCDERGFFGDKTMTSITT